MKRIIAIAAIVTAILPAAASAHDISGIRGAAIGSPDLWEYGCIGTFGQACTWHFNRVGLVVRNYRFTAQTVTCRVRAHAIERDMYTHKVLWSRNWYRSRTLTVPAAHTAWRNGFFVKVPGKVRIDRFRKGITFDHRLHLDSFVNDEGQTETYVVGDMSDSFQWNDHCHAA